MRQIQRTQRQDGRAVVLDLEEVEGKSERHHAGVHTGKLPFSGLAGQSNEDERKGERQPRTPQTQRKGWATGVNRFLAQSNTSGGVVGRKFFALAREVVGQRRIASYGLSTSTSRWLRDARSKRGVHIVGVQVDVFPGVV